jgi:hypothetical protein
MAKYTIDEIARLKGMSKSNTWWHVKKLWSIDERAPMFVRGTFTMNQAQAHRLMERIDSVPDIKKQARGPREEKKERK